MKSLKSLLWGLVFIVLGLILGLNALDIINVNLFFDGWWTLFIIVPSFIDLFGEESKTGSIIGLVIGISLFLCCQDLLSFELVWKLALPTILIICGVSMLIKNTGVKTDSNKGKKEYCATFSGEKIDLTNDDFTGTNLNAIFGGIELDLRNANITSDVVINATSIFGGIDILLPTNVNVKTSSKSIFGGIENKFKNRTENTITVYINGTCLFGGVEIK